MQTDLRVSYNVLPAKLDQHRLDLTLDIFNVFLFWLNLFGE